MENQTFWNIRNWVWIAVLWVGFSGQSAYASTSESNSDNITNSLSGVDPVTFTFNCIDGKPGDTICIPVTVQDFNDIVIFQYEIIWDSDILDFIEIQNPGSPSINVNADFNLSGPNTLKVIPLGFPIMGESLPDGTVLFEICFRIIGTPGSTSPVGISPFFDFEVADVNSVVPSDSINCVMAVDPAVELVGFLTSCGPAILGGNGEIDLTVYGGTASYTVTLLETNTGTPGGPIFIPAEGGSMVLSVPEGNYDVTIIDALGSMITYNIDVDALALGVTTRLRHPTCYKFENGTMWIKPSGGSQPFSFIWESLTDPSLAGSGFIRFSGDSALVTSLPDGMYRILVKDKNGCEAEIISVLNDNPFVFNVTAMQDATCTGMPNGFIGLKITGGTPDIDTNYTITTSPGFVITTDEFTVGALNPGDYCITVSDEVSQCDTVYCFTIGFTTTISANVTPTDASCAGGMDGSVQISGLTNGLSGPMYSYKILDDMDNVVTSINNFAGPFTYMPLAPGNYAAVVNEGPCTSDTIPFMISEPLPMTVTLDGRRPDNCLPSGSGDVWFTVTNGTGPYILDSTMGTQDGDSLENLNAGNYILTVTDNNGCTATLPFSIFDGDDNEEADITFQINGVPCEAGSTVTVLYQGGPIPMGAGVLWSNGLVTPTIPIEDPDTLSVDIILGAPIFCILDDTVIINCANKLELAITIIQPSCNNEAVGGPYTGTVIVDTMNAVAPVTFYWSFPDTTTTGTYAGLSPGLYYVTVTDAMDSIAIDSFEIIAPDAIDLTFGIPDSVTCPGICDGEVRIIPSDGDPTMDYFLYWTTTTSFADTGVIFQIDSICEGTTVFSVSQDGICFYEDTIEIFTPAPVELDLVSAIDATCHGYADGSLEVIASGGTPGYTYDWAGGPSSAIYNGIVAGEYFVSVVDSKNCTTTDSFTIVEPDTLIAQINFSATRNLSCGASNDGIVVVDVSGGNPGAYTFQWNPNVSTIYQAVNLAAGNYLITVTDPAGCSDTTSYNLTSPPPIIVEWPDVAPPDCFGDETVLQIDSVTGGNGNYSFNINGGQLFDLGDPILIPSGIYIVSVFDDRGCSADSTYMVMEPNPIIVSIGPDNPIIDLGDSLFLLGQIDQSDNPIAMMNWSGEVPVGCPTCDGTWVFNFLPTLYTWTVTDINGCQGSATITVGVDFERDVFIPTVFTPNFDGRNDDFKIYTGHGVESINYFYIYDRWGNLVHSETMILPTPDGAGSWDGTFDGEALSPGVYVYVAEVQFIDNETKLIFKGDITLIK